MSERHENALQTAARWGCIALIGIGAVYLLFKIITAWVAAWYRVPGML